MEKSIDSPEPSRYERIKSWFRLDNLRTPKDARVSEQELAAIYEEHGEKGFRVLPSAEAPLVTYHRGDEEQ